MAKYRRTTPLTIKAVQFTGNNLKEILLSTGGHLNPNGDVMPKKLAILLPVLTVGSWVVEDTEDGRLYACGSHFLKENFELVEEGDDGK